MKNILTLTIMLCMVLIFTNTASALTLYNSSTEIGEKDRLLAETQQLSGETAELDWVRSILGNSIEFIIKHDELGEDDWQATSEEGTWAFALDNDPDYFLIKTGNISGTSNREFLFENTDSLKWAVIDLEDIHIFNIFNIDKISHLNEYTATAVPEPSTILLLGAGVLGLVIHGRRRYSKP